LLINNFFKNILNLDRKYSIVYNIYGHATIADGITDGIVPSVFHWELEKNYGLVPQLPAESQTALTDGHHRHNSSVGISQRVGKKLRACATITDGITDGITVEFYRRNIPSVNCGGNFFFGTLIRLYVGRKFRQYFCFLLPTDMAMELELPTLMTLTDLFRRRYYW